MDNSNKSNVNFNEIIEKIKSLTNRSYVQSMPPCAEKTILNLQIKIAESYNIDRAALDLKVYLEDVQTFEAQVIEESLGSHKITLKCKKLKELLNKLPRQVRGDIVKDTFNSVTSILPEIRTIDSNLLYHLLKEILKASDKLIDKIVILILGKTGSGKSTTIQFLGGSRLRLVTDSETGYDRYEIISYGNEALRSFIISSNSNSETMFINAVDIEFNGRVYTLVDTPGFGDNRGIEIDISNTLGIAAAIRKCSSVRILTLSSQSSVGDKSDGIIEDFYTISKFIDEVSKYLDSFTYWFTKFPISKATNLSKIINDKRNNFVFAEDEEDIIELLNDMSEKCSIVNGGAVILDPINSDQILLFQNIIDTKPIENPNVIFQTFTSNQNLLLLKSQLNQDVHSIDSAISNNRFDIVEYKLNHLLTMQLVIDLPEFTDAYINCVSKIYQIVDKLRVKIVGELNKLKNNENNYIKDDLLALSYDIIELLKFENIRENHFSTMPIFVDACLLEISNISQQWSESISNKLNIFHDSNNGRLNLTYDLNLVSQSFVTLRKLNCLVEIFGETFIKECSIALKRELDIRIFQYVYDCNSASINQSMNILTQAVQYLNDYLEQGELIEALQLLPFIRLLTNEWNVINEKYQQLFLRSEYFIISSESYVNKYSDSYNKVIRLFSSNDSNIVTEENLKIISKSFSLLSCLNEKKDLLLDLFNDKIVGINETNELLMSTVNQYMLSNHKNIKSIIDSDGRVYVNSVVIKRIYDILSPLLAVLREGQLLEQVYKEYNDIKSTIKSFINSLREKLSQDINLMHNDRWKVDLKSFFHILDILKESSCIFELDDSIQNDNDYTVIVEEFRQLLLSQQNKISQSDLSYKNPQLLSSLAESINMMYEITLLAGNYNTVTSCEEVDIVHKDSKNVDISQNDSNFSAEDIREAVVINAVKRNMSNNNECHVCSKGFGYLFPNKVQCNYCNGKCHDKCAIILKDLNKKLRMCLKCKFTFQSTATFKKEENKFKSVQHNQNTNLTTPLNNDRSKDNKSIPINTRQNVDRSLADISQLVIDIIREKVSHQIQLSLLLFPPNSPEEYYLNIVEVWSAIEFLSIANDFKFEFNGIKSNLESIQDFAKSHFNQKKSFLNTKYDLVLSPSSDLTTKSESLSVVTSIIDYIIKLREYYRNNQKYLTNQRNEYHALVFNKSTNEIYLDWLEIRIPNTHKRIKDSSNKDYSTVSSNLTLAQAFSLLDPLIPLPDNKFKPLTIVLEYLLKEMSSSIEVYISNCHYDKVTEFFTSQNIKVLDMTINAQLTSSIKEKLKSLSSKITNIIKIGDFGSLQLELDQLRLARKTILEYLNEPLKSNFPKRIEIMENSIHKLLIVKLAHGANNSDFGIREKYFQSVLRYYNLLFCDSIGVLVSDCIVYDDLPKIVENNRLQIKSLVVSEMKNISNKFEMIVSNVTTTDNERKNKSDTIDRNSFISRQINSSNNNADDTMPFNATDYKSQLSEIILSLNDQIKSVNPKTFIIGLENASNVGEPLFYNQLIGLISQMLNDNVDKIIALLEKPIASNIKNSLQNLLTKISVYMPTQVQNNIESVLKSQREKERIERETVERELRIENSSNNFTNNLTNLKLYYERRRYDYVIDAITILKGHLRNSLEQYSIDINNGKLLVVLNNLPTECELYCDYLVCCQNIHRTMRHYYSFMCLDNDNTNRLFQIINKIGGKLLGEEYATIPQVNINIIDHDIFKSINKKLDILTSLMVSYGISTPLSSFWDIMTKKFPSMRNDTVTALVNVVKVLEEYCKLIKSEINNKKISLKKLSDLLIPFKDSDEVIMKLKKIIISNTNVELFSTFLPKELEYKVSNLSTYNVVLKDINDVINSYAKNCNIYFDHNILLTQSSIDRREFFEILAFNFLNLKSAVDIQSHYELNKFSISDLIDARENHIINQFDQIKEDGQHLISLIFSDPLNPNIDIENCVNLNAYLDSLQCALEIFSKDNSTKNLGNIIKKYLDNIKISFIACLNSYKQNVQSNFKGKPIELIKCLECLKICSCNIDIFQIFADKLIDNILDSEEDSTNIGIIKIINDNPNNQYYQMLQQHNKFEDSLSKIWQDYISRFTIDQVLDRKYGMKVSRDSIELSDWEFDSIQSKLRKLYDRFDHRYKELVNDGMIGINRSTQMTDIISYAQNASIDRTLKFDEQILELMACLFSYWTLSKIKKSNDQDQSSDSDSSNSSLNSTPNTEASHASVLIKPHAGQIIALLRIFGLDSPSGKIDNHIIEILTGEGKSIVLGVTATILALLGYSVDCVCYSSYLSKRDKESFSYLFQAFEVDDYINYGTLTELCEKTIEDLAGGSIRDTVLRSLGINSSGTHKFTKSSRRKVLLMDEVDMFFNDDFYGNAYTPVARLVDPTITDVVNYIWSLRDDPKNFNTSKVLKSNQFIACKNRFHQYSNVIEESVKYMFFQLKELLDDSKAGREPSSAHVPYVVLDSIAYKDQDSLSSKISLGYKTMWTYFFENSKRNITDKSRDSQICIRLDCGQYSIAEVPKLYEHILGVSGTITALMNDKVLTDAYNIHKETKIPSVYGENKLRFITVGNYADIKISMNVSHFIDITNEITKQSEVEIDGNKFHRPVLVFFESIAELNKYYNSPSAQKNKNRTKILTEREPDTSKTNLIRHATNANTITLLTREFGRGIDFIVYDEKVRRAGGPHAIQTFFSEGISEEIQIKGRTARQGGDGSYSMVFSLDQLEKFKSGSDSLISLFDSKEYGPVLDNLRIQYVDTVRGSMALRVNSCMPQHNMSLDFINSLVARNLYKINEYLELFNKCPNEYLVNTNTRVLVLMDATGSMSACITNAKNAVGEMFKQIQTILKENNEDSSFEIQFAVYRNYNAPMDQIIEWSEWTSDPSVLYSFIEKIKALFGLGREAVEMGLWHLNREMTMSNDANKPISRVILIGDQPPNTAAEVVAHRQTNHGEAYWISKKIGPATTYLDQLKLIKQKNENILINSFYLNGEAARTVFTEIAEITGGVCKSLDVTDVKKAAQFLCQQAAVNILDAINNNSTKLAKGQLVDSYKQMFKGYIQ